MHSRGNSLLKEPDALKELHEIREKLYKMDDKEKEKLLKEIKEKFKDLF